mgnify:CR=1 FL=1|jgi:hypothetical protein|tara:strand:- start:331 stop:588 length:258 start_codon:yes stop_codon:yes gene_type:complete
MDLDDDEYSLIDDNILILTEKLREEGIGHIYIRSSPCGERFSVAINGNEAQLLDLFLFLFDQYDILLNLAKVAIIVKEEEDSQNN